ncbi:response regulator transcription factor [Burkholderia vietnamiensis]|uniref:response regulator transcription factor n=1 Tax=Burkholderia vietnamiensis TaxID=60552 RepID=UPI001B9AA78D|nr:response regulator transcription factor [Burkholderia vietnamiensis]MBR8036272.1 response regulator transcription factor [Burkholderia vietnamiensis]
MRAAVVKTGDFHIVGESSDDERMLALLRSVAINALTLGTAMPGLHRTELVKAIKTQYPGVWIQRSKLGRAGLSRGGTRFVIKHIARR